MERPVQPPMSGGGKRDLEPGWWAGAEPEARARAAGQELSDRDMLDLERLRKCFHLDEPRQAGGYLVQEARRLAGSIPGVANLRDGLDAWKKKGRAKDFAKRAMATPAAVTLPPFDPEDKGASAEGSMLGLEDELPDDFQEKWQAGEYVYKR
uniref:Uncharacterized protein n=1 Tax=Hemiselmis andersenii TaxID=464988 RepID=A0A6T8L878_HEMAN